MKERQQTGTVLGELEGLQRHQKLSKTIVSVSVLDSCELKHSLRHSGSAQYDRKDVLKCDTHRFKVIQKDKSSCVSHGQYTLWQLNKCLEKGDASERFNRWAVYVGGFIFYPLYVWAVEGRCWPHCSCNLGWLTVLWGDPAQLTHLRHQHACLL